MVHYSVMSAGCHDIKWSVTSVHGLNPLDSSVDAWFFSAPKHSIELVKIISLEKVIFILFFISASTMKYFEMRHIESESFIPIRNDSSLPLMLYGKIYSSACTPRISNPKVWRRDGTVWKMTSPLSTPITDVRISFTYKVKFKE